MVWTRYEHRTHNKLRFLYLITINSRSQISNNNFRYLRSLCFTSHNTYCSFASMLVRWFILASLFPCICVCVYLCLWYTAPFMSDMLTPTSLLRSYFNYLSCTHRLNNLQAKKVGMCALVLVSASVCTQSDTTNKNNVSHSNTWKAVSKRRDIQNQWLWSVSIVNCQLSIF